MWASPAWGPLGTTPLHTQQAAVQCQACSRRWWHCVFVSLLAHPDGARLKEKYVQYEHLNCLSITRTESCTNSKILLFLPFMWRVVILAGGDSPLELRAHTVTSQLAQTGTKYLLAFALMLVRTNPWSELLTLTMYSIIFPLAMEMSVSCSQRNV